mgnify:CR=1 FL=1
MNGMNNQVCPLFPINLWMYFIVPSLAALLLVFTVFKTRSGFVDKVQDWLGNIYPDTWYFAEQIEKALSFLGGALGELFVWLMLVNTGYIYNGDRIRICYFGGGNGADAARGLQTTNSLYLRFIEE